MKDPFLKSIRAALDEPLDAHLFEQCAAELIRDEWPVVPVPGGSDAGMDGAVADGEGEAFPLVTTTAQDAIGNLTRNLNSYREEKGSEARSKVIFATSRALTPPRRRNLEERARDLGFMLIQVYDQSALAPLLYRSPSWCKRLLGLTGTPFALSAIPKTKRPLLDEPLVGREDELAWLQSTEGDRLVAGQPGAGKTSLLRQLAREGRGLFVVSGDRGEIADALRAQQPSCLFVDDAHVRLPLIDDLRQLREDLGASFSILACTWPSGTDVLKQHLGITSDQVLELPLMTRDEIVQVVAEASLSGPVELIRHIVDQADGRPGLAVTLARLAMKGGTSDVVYGDALSADLLSALRPVVGPEPEDVLAVLSVGGRAGMPAEVAASVLGLRPQEVRQTLSELAAGGVIMEVPDLRSLGGASTFQATSCVQVRPDAFRHVLIRDVFFRSAGVLHVEDILPQAPSIKSALMALLGAKARGADIDEGKLQRLVEEVNSPAVWQAYASLGEEEARWVLRHYPERILTVAREALRSTPLEALSLLLGQAVGDRRPLHSTPGHPLRIIQDWVLSGRPGSGEPLERRTTLLRAAQAFIENRRGANSGSGSDAHEGAVEVEDAVEAGVKAMQLALSPNFQNSFSDPGSGQSIRLQFAALSAEEIRSLAPLWDEFWAFVDASEIHDWTPILEGFHDWIYPCRWGGGVAEDVEREARTCIERQIRKAVRRASHRPGLLRRLERLAKPLDVEVDLSGHEAFAVLYPQDNLEYYEEAWVRHQEAVAELAEAWSQHDPERVAQEVKAIEEEARSASVRYPRYTDLLCTELAGQVDTPIGWLDAFIRHELSQDLVAPFLRRAAEANSGKWQDRAEDMARQLQLSASPIRLALTEPGRSENLTELVLSRLDGHETLVRSLCLQGRVPDGMLRRLLTHDSAEVRRAAAAGEWRTDPRGTVRPSVQKAWQEVVINDLSSEPWLAGVFEAYPDVAFEWIRAQLQRDQASYLSRENEIIDTAVRSVSRLRRRELLGELRSAPGHRRWARALVGVDVDLYDALLERAEVKSLHLAPLHDIDQKGMPERKDTRDREGIPQKERVPEKEGIPRMIVAALEAGFTPEEIVQATDPLSSEGFSAGFVGDLQDEYQRKLAQFEKLKAEDDPGIQKVGEIGYSVYMAKIARRDEKRRRDEIYGRR